MKTLILLLLTAVACALNVFSQEAEKVEKAETNNIVLPIQGKVVVTNGKQTWFFEPQGTNVSCYMYPTLRDTFSPRQLLNSAVAQMLKQSLLKEGYTLKPIEETRYYCKMNPPTYYNLDDYWKEQERITSAMTAFLDEQRKQAEQAEVARQAADVNRAIAQADYNNGKTVHVNGYFRQNGTYVNSYWRHRPSE